MVQYPRIILGSAPFPPPGAAVWKEGNHAMKKNTVVILGAAIALLLVVGIVLGLTHFIIVDGGLYPRQAQALDLRDRNLTAEEYEALAAKLPQCYIVWGIPFQGGTLSSDTETLTVTTLSDGDVDMLDYALSLKSVDGWECQDYAQLARLRQRHPGAQVRYHMTVSGVECDQDTSELTLKGLSAEDAQKLPALLNLTSLRISDCDDYALLRSLQQQNPNWNLSYTVALGDQAAPWDSETLTAKGAGEEVTRALEGLPNLKKLTLVNPKADGSQLAALQAAYPQVELGWELELEGKTFAWDLTEVDISHFPSESAQSIRDLASYFPKAEKLIVDNGAVDYETMAALREELREKLKLVWTVMCGVGGKRGPIAVRTDETTFMPIKHKVWYFLDDDVYNLRYCEDMICVDVGHMTFSDCSFAGFMPHLKYLILAHTSVRDISPLRNCKELIFLELDWSLVTDYSPLVECTALEDLNLGNLYGAVEPLLKMTWLKNLWWKDCSYTKQQALKEALTETNMMFNLTFTVGNGWRQLQNYYDMRDILEMPYMK